MEEEDGDFGATDTRMGVMGIISFLPYFNWLVSGTRRVLLLFPLRCYFDLMGFSVFPSCN
jgi:hypothetical protein